MSAMRSSIFLVFVLMGVSEICSKPFSEDFICDLFCTDDDGSTSTIASNSRDWWDDLCNDCADDNPINSVNLIIPPSQQGMQFSLQNNNGNLSINMTAISPPATPAPATTAAPTTAAPTTAPAASSTAAATTAAGTTAAPTTAALAR